MKQKTLGVVSLSLGALALGGCQFSKPEPFNPEAIARIQKENAATAPPRHMEPLPTTLPSTEQIRSGRLDPATTRPSLKVRGYGPTARLALQEVIHNVVMNNRDVRVAGYQAAIDEVRILEAEARFDPTVFSDLSIQKSFPQGFNPILTPQELLQQVFDGGIRQQLESGGQLELRYTTTRSEYQQISGFSTAGIDTRVYDNSLTLKLTQPLLRDFGTETNRARITIARNDQKISQLDFRDQLEKTIEQAEETYWKLYFAEKDVEIQERLLKDNETTLDIMLKRMVGDVGRVQVSQAWSRVLQRNVSLVDARQRVEDASDQLKLLMNDPELPVNSRTVILPADAPVLAPIEYTLEDQIEAGITNRLELKQQTLRIDSAATVVRAAINNDLPKLDLVLSGGVEGLGNNFKHAFDNQWDTNKFLPYQIGFQFEVPIGNRAARAIYQRTLLQHAQAVEQWKATADKVASEIKTAMTEVYSAWDQLVAARNARFAAEDALSAIELRERAGTPLTPEFLQLKLDFQQTVSEAERTEAQDIARYNVALSAIEKAKGTLLRYNNIQMKEEPGPMFTKYWARMWEGNGK
jgi:outer membrane protein TolC